MTAGTEVDHSPARLSSVLSVSSMAVATLAIGLLGVPLATVAVLSGVALLALGVHRGSRRAVSLGAFAAFLGVLLAGVVGAAPEPLLVGATGVVLAWDLGEQAINVGEQLGRAARTTRGELVHAASGTAVGAVAVGLGYGVYVLATGGQPLAALVLLLVAAIALIETVRD